MGRDGPEVKPERVTVVSITVNGKFRVDATINKEHMLQRIHTWVADPVLGDMNYEHEFTNASYVDWAAASGSPPSGTRIRGGTTTMGHRPKAPATTPLADP